MRLVIVDDNADFRELLPLLLEPPLRVVAALATVEAAIAYAGWDDVDVALIDWVLPHGGGRVVLEALERDHPWVQRIVFTAHTVDGVEDPRVDAVVSKFDLASLKGVVLQLEPRHAHGVKAAQSGDGDADVARGVAPAQDASA